MDGNKDTKKAGAVVKALFPAASALICLLLCEWIARGELTAEMWKEFFLPHGGSYLLALLFLLCIYYLIDGVFRFAPLAVFVMGLFACIPAAVNYYMLKLRGEPFLPWSFVQLGEAGDVLGAAGLKLQPTMVWAAGIMAALMLVSFFLYRRHGRVSLPRQAARVAGSLAALAVVMMIYLSPTATRAFGIWPDAWMQDRYYRWHGVITGFMTNLQNLEIDKPDDYSREAVADLLAQTRQQANSRQPLFGASYAAQTDAAEKTPTILYVMDESYWDATELCQYGIAFDTDLSPNLHRLQQQSAYGKIYSPSFGGGTCDVEFEALTGYSVSYLPSGSKPYQQHVTRTMSSLPNVLKERGYQTAAVHCFYRKYWSRNTAYPFLGLDEFVSLENMYGTEKVRGYEWKGGLVSDRSMGEQIIAKYEQMKQTSDAPVFLHAVTMQNHTNYHAANYADEDRVRVTAAPAELDQTTIGALEDFATGVKAADDLLGALTDYFSQVDEPVILVFWGDHYNPIGAGYDVYTKTGYADGDASDPKLRQTTLLIWSNYYEGAVDLGTIGTYQLSPVVAELYGLDKPDYFEYLLQQLQNGYRSRTAGRTVALDGTVSEELTEEQQRWYQNQWLLQYDLMFGEEYALEE